MLVLVGRKSCGLRMSGRVAASGRGRGRGVAWIGAGAALARTLRRLWPSPRDHSTALQLPLVCRLTGLRFVPVPVPDPCRVFLHQDDRVRFSAASSPDAGLRQWNFGSMSFSSILLFTLFFFTGKSATTTQQLPKNYANLVINAGISLSYVGLIEPQSFKRPFPAQTLIDNAQDILLII